MTEGEKWILGCTIVMAVGTIGAMIVMIIALNKKQEVKVDQPVSITITEELHNSFAAKESFDKHCEENRREIENIFSKIGGVDRGAGNKISAEVTAIHARINLLDKSSGRLEATTELQNEKLKSMDSKLDGMPDRVIATLRNTGAIGRTNS